MKKLAVTAAGAALFATTLLLPIATEAQNPGALGIPGYLDPTTGTFAARANLLPTAAARTVSSTITVTTTVLLDSTIPTGLPISCSVGISTFDNVASNGAGGSAALVRAGGKGTCTVTITFLWQVAPTTTAMSLSVSVSAGSFGTDQSRSASTGVQVPLTTRSKAVTLAM